MRAYLLLMFFALGVTIFLTPVVRRLALTFNVLGPLRERDVHVVPTPRMGGIALTVGFLGAVALGSQIPYFEPAYHGTAIWAVAGGAAAICGLGVVDDIWELDWMAKLAGQLLIAGVMAIYGVQLVSFPVFGLTIGSARLSLVVSVLVLVTVVNAVNFIDGLDGLAAGVIAIGATSFFLYSYILTRITGAQSYATVSAVAMIALVGGCLGFLWYNFHPASIFMGDSGAMVLGLVMGAAGITVTGQINPSQLGAQTMVASFLPILLPLVVVVIPIADLVFTAARRLLTGKSPFQADRTHFHDRLLNHGHSHRGVVVILYAWTALACAVGVSLLLFDPLMVGSIGFAFGLVLLWATHYFLPGFWDATAPSSGMLGGGVPGAPKLIDEGIEIISRPQIKWRDLIIEELGAEAPTRARPKWREVNSVRGNGAPQRPRDFPRKVKDQ